MSQQIINELQNPYSYEKYVNEYLNTSLSSLANSGQRFGIKSDGVHYINTSCADIFNINYNNKDISNLLLELYINNKSVKQIKIVQKNSDTNNITNSTISIDDITEFKDELLISSIDNNTLKNIINFSFNNIDSISSESYIKLNNNIFTGFLKGRINQDNDNCVLTYFQYNTESNLLLHEITTQYFGRINEYDDWYIVYKLDYDSKENNKDQYLLSIYLFRLAWLGSYIKDNYSNTASEITENEYSINIKNFYTYYDGTESKKHYNCKDKLFSFFNNEFINYDNFSYDGINLNNISFLNFLFNYTGVYNNDSFLNLTSLNKIPIVLSNNIFSFKDTNAGLKKYDTYGYISNNELNIFLANLQNLFNIYYQTYIYFNQINYFNSNNNNTLYKYIIYQLYQNIKDEFNQNNIDDIMYIPLTYKFNCFVSDVNPAKIYFINLIYVKFVNNVNDINELNKIYYYNDSIINHTSMYDIHINYNSINDSDIVNSIEVVKLHTLPYINSLNNWVIDDIDTFSSINQEKYIGIKQLFIYTYVEGNQLKSELINLNDDIIEKYFDYEEAEFTVNKKFFKKYYETTINCKTQIPKISNLVSNNTLEFFKNTLIVSICNKNVLNYSNSSYTDCSEDYGLDYIYSIWRLKNDNSFEVVTLENEYAYDPYDNLSNINSQQEYQYINYLNTKNNILNNSAELITDNYYLVMRNKSAKYYANNYLNDYNAIIEYVTNLKNDGSNPVYKDSKFINNISQLNVTNNIYPQYDVMIHVTNIESLEYELSKLEKKNNTMYISILVNGNNNVISQNLTVQSIDDIYQYVAKLVPAGVNYIEIGIKYQNVDYAKYYNEYVFNQQVPTIDLKEIFVRNNNNLNRVNILGINTSENGTNIYNGFIGTKYSDISKDTLYISTSNTNINIGTDTLLNINQYNKFKQYNKLQIDNFNDVGIDANNDIILESTNEISTNSALTNIKSGELNVDSNIITLKTNLIINSIKSEDSEKGFETWSNKLIGKFNRIFVMHSNDIERHITNNSIDINYFNSLYGFTEAYMAYDFDQSLFIPVYGEVQIDSSNQYKLLYLGINLNLLFKQIFNIDITKENLLNSKIFKFPSTAKLLQVKFSATTDSYNTWILLVNEEGNIFDNKTYQNYTELKEYLDQITNDDHIYNYLFNIAVYNMSYNADNDSIVYDKIIFNFDNNNQTTLKYDESTNNKYEYLKKMLAETINYQNIIVTPSVQYQMSIDINSNISSSHYMNNIISQTTTEANQSIEQNNQLILQSNNLYSSSQTNTFNY